MRLIRRILFISLVVWMGSLSVQAQDFSNKGKDFWLCFPSHVPNIRNNVVQYAKMSLFITADRNSSGTVTTPGGFTASFSVLAGQVAEVDVPYNQAHINAAEASTVVKKGIRVQVDAGKPAVVVYAHIYAGFRSAASLILPAAALGKKYFSMNALQASIDGSKSQFVVVAKDTNTIVRITPVVNGAKLYSYIITLPQPGDVYEVQNNDDLSGSIIESISSGSSTCKNIAVFSGSSGIHLPANAACTPGYSYDPLYQQLYPVNTWGKQYGLIPFANYPNGVPYRVIASENNTTVSVNGLPVAILDEGEFYPTGFAFVNTESKSVFISGDKPVSVAQFAQSSNCSGFTPPVNQGYGDPDMILLNPVEQNIDAVTLFASNKENIYAGSKFINVLIKDNATGSFTINGATPVANWQPMLPNGTGYSFAKIQLPDNPGTFALKADSAFNAFAYGFGDYESYAYSAGTHVRDLYKTMTIENEFGKGQNPIGCKDKAFKITMTFPYIPTRIKVNFNGLFTNEDIINPVPVESFTVNGKIVYRFRLTGPYIAASTGTFPVSVLAENNLLLTCSNGTEETDYEISIVENPKADFNFLNTGCVNDQVSLIDNSNGPNSSLVKWYWTMGDGEKSESKDTLYRFQSQGNYTVSHWGINQIGCGTDTMNKVLRVSPIPAAQFGITSPVLCEQSAIVFTDQSSVPLPSAVQDWQWNFGDNNTMTYSSPQTIQHTYLSPGVYPVSLQVKTQTGCASTIFNSNVVINAKPNASFKAPAFCLPEGTGTFLNTSSISDGTAQTMNYSWDFGDNSSSTDKDPVHQYTSIGPFNVRLITSSAAGCSDDSTIIVQKVYPQERIAAAVIPGNCVGDTSYVSVNTITAGNNSLSRIFWRNGNTGPFADTLVASGATNITLKVVYTAPGNQAIELFGLVSNTGCYTDTLRRGIFVNRLPNPMYTIPQSLCDGEAIQFVNTSTSIDGSINQWNWTINNNQVFNTEQLSPVLNSGSYTIKLSVTTDRGCTAETTESNFNVTVKPVVNFSIPGICLTDPLALFISESTIADGSEGQFSYIWNFGDGNATNANPNTSTARNGQHRYTAVGNYNVNLKVISKDGCAADTTKLFTVNGVQPLAGFTLQADSICGNEQLRLTDLSSVDFGKILRTEIYWDFFNNPLTREVDSLPAFGKTYLHTYSNIANTDRIYTIKYIVYSGTTCVAESQKQVYVKGSPKLTMAPFNRICENESIISLKQVTIDPPINGYGYYKGKGVVDGQFFNPAAAGSGLHRITYIFNAENGCSTSVEGDINVVKTPVVSAGPDKVIAGAGSVLLNGTISGQGIVYNWTPVEFISSATSLNPMVSPATDMVYRLTAVSPEGCISFDEVKVTKIDKIYVPTAFTPNNDGKNDIWEIPGLKYFTNCKVQVFNRWGQLVFHSEGYKQPWNGKTKDADNATTVFVWVIDLKDGKKPLTGTVTVIK
jgi:gliding motility-associated-like protein